MAIRFDASADYLSRIANLINYNSAYTTMLWMYLSSDTNSYSHFWAICASATEAVNDYQNSDFVGTHSDGTTLRLGAYVAGVGTAATSTALSIGTWYHITVRRNSATSLEVFVNGIKAGATITVDVSARTAVAGEYMGRFNGGYRLDGRVFGFKQWSVALTDKEIASEIYTIQPNKFSSIAKWTPMLTGSPTTERARDYGGGNYSWTENGTITSEQSPPVSWGGRSALISSAASGPQVYELTFTDGIFLDDGDKNISSDFSRYDSIFVQESIFKDVQKTMFDSLLLYSSYTAEQLAGVIELTIIDYLFLKDSFSKDVEKNIQDSVLLASSIVRTAELFKLDELLVGSESVRELIKTVKDTILLSDSSESEYDIYALDAILMNDSDKISFLIEMMRRDDLILSDSITTQIITAIIAALVYAKITTEHNFLGVDVRIKSDFMGVTIDTKYNFLGIETGLLSEASE